MKKSFLNSRISVTITFAATMFFMLICGFTSSVVRSGITYIVMLFGDFIHRKSEGLASLSFAGILIVLINPFVAGNVGFLISVASTFGILVIYSLIAEKVYINSKILSGLVSAALISLSTFVATMSISILYAVSASLVLAVGRAVIGLLPFASMLCQAPLL